ncbi:MAG: hypothetical protein HOJ35_12315 [Bdellovibrionales bacterium]|nr:hypothetical protein [Bdellovibrionales bacterium]
MDNQEVIIGIHSIIEAIKNKRRENLFLYGTKSGLELIANSNKLSVDEKNKFKKNELNSHEFQEISKKLFSQGGFNYQRVTSQILLSAEKLPVDGIEWIMRKINNGEKLKIFCLDQVTDIHNTAAILRTASFYGVDCLVTGMKGKSGKSPGFYRIASGATEHVKIIECSSLPKFIRKLMSKDVRCVGFSEHSENNSVEQTSSNSIALIVGSEDTGLSHALTRVISEMYCINALGATKSLNVSVASAIAMERFFN